jgi:hypothetical protein
MRFFVDLLQSARSAFNEATCSETSVCAETKLKNWRAANKEKIESGLKEQKALVTEKLSELERWDDPAKASFKKAFGTEDEATRALVKKRMEKVLALNKTMTVENFKPAEDSVKGRFAYVYPDDKKHTIYLDEAFERSGATGSDTRAGVLCHEMSHFEDIGGTHDAFRDYDDGDTVYGPASSRELAQTRPDLAAAHADSFEYYLENAP